MLNEIKEYEQYTYPLDVKHPAIRLKHKTLCNELSGTARAMTIIARKSIFDYVGPGRIDHAKNELRVWCGDPKGKLEKASEGIVFAWLPEYMVKHLGEEKALKFEDYLMTETGLDTLPHYSEVCSLFKDIRAYFNIDTFREKDSREQLMDKAKRLRLYCKELGDDETQRKKTSGTYAPVYRVINALNILNGRYGTNGYNKKLFNENPDRTEKNDFKKIMYEKIIADAITAGPLKRYYLICEKTDFSGISVQTKEKTSYPFTESKKSDGEWSSPTKKKADLIMKTVAAFLLEQESRDAEDLYEGFVPVNLTDIANWLAGSTGTDMLKSFGIESRPLFTFDAIDNVAAISIDVEWMKSCGWRIIPEGSLDTCISDHPELEFYSDLGAGQFLRKGIRYL